MEFWGFESRQELPGEGFGLLMASPGTGSVDADKLISTLPANEAQGDYKEKLDETWDSYKEATAEDRKSVAESAKALGIAVNENDLLDPKKMREKIAEVEKTAESRIGAKDKKEEFLGRISAVREKYKEKGELSESHTRVVKAQGEAGKRNYQKGIAILSGENKSGKGDSTGGAGKVEKGSSSETSSPTTAAASNGSGPVRTASTADTLNGVANTLNAGTNAANAGVGLYGTIGNFGMANRYNQAAWGMAPGPVGFSFSSPNTGYSGGVGGFGTPGVGIGSFGPGYAGVGGFGGAGVQINSSGGGGFAGGVGFGPGFGAVNAGPEAHAHALDALISELMAAIASGNVDMIESAITVLNLKSKTTLIGASLKMTEALRQYDRSMKGISDQIGALAGAGGGADQNARLQQLGAEMNQISMYRQGLTNMVRDIMSMVEEMGTLENSIYSKKDRESQFYRWA